MTRTILISIVCIISAIISPIYFRATNDTINDVFNNVTSAIISSVASILTFIIAILVYNKFGIETILVEKQTSTVCAFLEVFNSTSFFVYGGSYELQIEMRDIYSRDTKQHLNGKLIFSWEYIEGLKRLFLISNSPFMPKKISDKVQKLKFSSLSYDLKRMNIKTIQ